MERLALGDSDESMAAMQTIALRLIAEYEAIPRDSQGWSPAVQGPIAGGSLGS